MRKHFLKNVLILLILLIGFQTSFAQTKEELRQRQIKTQESIELTNKLLEQTEKSKSAGLNKLLIINKRIVLRERLINEISEEINALNKEIEKNSDNIIKLESDLKVLKEEYARMIYYAYKNRNNFNRMMFVLAAEDFNQAYRRMRYFKEYAKYRKKQDLRLFFQVKLE